jgi:hypothetical protein
MSLLGHLGLSLYLGRTIHLLNPFRLCSMCWMTFKLCSMCWMMSARHENGFSQDGLGFMQPPTEWDGGVGFVSKGMIEANCPPPADDIQVTCAASPPTTLMCMSNCFPFCDSKNIQCIVLNFCIMVGHSHP